MLSYLIFVLFQVSPKEEAKLLEDLEFGIKILLENITLEKEKQIGWETRIIKLGERLRIEETFPNSNEVGKVIVWNGKECKLFIPNRQPQPISPVRNGLEFIGFRGEYKEGIKWKVDKVSKLPVEMRIEDEIIYYKDYTMIENFGNFPTKIEHYVERKLVRRTKLKHLDKKVELRNELFDFNEVEFSDKAKELAKKFYPE